MPKQCCNDNCEFWPSIGMPAPWMLAYSHGEAANVYAAPEFKSFGCAWYEAVPMDQLRERIYGVRGDQPLTALIVGATPAGFGVYASFNNWQWSSRFVYSKQVTTDEYADWQKMMSSYWLPAPESTEEDQIKDYLASGGELIVCVPQLDHWLEYQSVDTIDLPECTTAINDFNNFLERIGSETRIERLSSRKYLNYSPISHPSPMMFLGYDSPFSVDWGQTTQRFLEDNLGDIDTAVEYPGQIDDYIDVPFTTRNKPIADGSGGYLPLTSEATLVPIHQIGSGLELLDRYPPLFYNPNKSSHLGYHLFCRHIFDEAQTYDSDFLQETTPTAVGPRGGYRYVIDHGHDVHDYKDRPLFPLFDPADRIKVPIGTTERRPGGGTIHCVPPGQWGSSFPSVGNTERNYSQHIHERTFGLSGVQQFRNPAVNSRLWYSLVETWYDTLCRSSKAGITSLFVNNFSYSAENANGDSVGLSVRTDNDAPYWPMYVRTDTEYSFNNTIAAKWDETEITKIAGTIQNDVYISGSSSSLNANEWQIGMDAPLSDFLIFEGLGNSPAVSLFRTDTVPVRIRSSGLELAIGFSSQPHALYEVNAAQGSESLRTKYNAWLQEMFPGHFEIEDGVVFSAGDLIAPFMYHDVLLNDSKYEPKYIISESMGRTRFASGSTIATNIALLRKSPSGYTDDDDYYVYGDVSVRVWQDGEWFYPVSTPESVDFQQDNVTRPDGYRFANDYVRVPINAFRNESGDELDLTPAEDNFIYIAPMLIVPGNRLTPGETYRMHTHTGLINVDMVASTPRRDFDDDTKHFRLLFETTDTTGGLELVKTAELRTTWADGNYIDYEFQITNVSGEELVAAELIDDTALGTGTGSSGGSWDEFDMEVDEVVTLTGEYQLTSDDITAGFVTNQAEVEASGPSGTYRAEDTVTISP